jgi:hypothetical protein
MSTVRTVSIALLVLGAACVIVYCARSPEESPTAASPQAVQAAELPPAPDAPLPDPGRDTQRAPPPRSQADVDAANRLAIRLMGGEPKEFVVLVEDANDKPVVGATVVALTREESADEPTVLGITDADGLVSALLAAPKLHTLLRCDTAQGETSGNIELRRMHPQADQPYVLHVFAPARMNVSGMVLDSSNHPAAGCEIRMYSSADVAGHGNQWLPSDLQSDANGAFQTVIESRGALVTFSAKRGEQCTPSKAVKCVPGAELNVELQFEGKHALIIDVFDVHNEFVREARATVWDGRPEHAFRIALTDPDGLLRVELTGIDHCWAVACTEAGSYSSVREVQFPQADSEQRIRLVVEESSSIRGRVVWDGHASISGIDLTPVRNMATSSAKNPAEQLGACACYQDGHLNGTTDASGAFLIGGLERGVSYDILCATDLHRPECRTLEPGALAGTTDLVIHLTDEHVRGGALHGHVVRKSTRQPVKEFGFHMYRRSGAFAWFPDQDQRFRSDTGEFHFECLAPGCQTGLWLFIDGAPSAVIESVTSDGSVKECEIELEEPGALEVFVTDSRKEPLAHCAISIVPVSELPLTELAHVTPRPDGGALYPSLYPGKYRVTVKHGTKNSEPLEATVVAGKSTRVDVQFPK